MWLFLRGPRCQAIVQNRSDLAVLRKELRTNLGIHLVPGSGVDPQEFKASRDTAAPPVLLFASRLLWSKGIERFVAATRSLHAEGIACMALIAGTPDHDNPEAVPESQLRSWQKEGIVRWLGHVNDMPGLLGRASIVVLPTSYGEGIPRILIEAAACGLSIIASDNPGCREVVIHEHNGLLVPADDREGLVIALRTLLSDRSRRQIMGQKGREIFLQRFTQDRIITDTFEVYSHALQRSFVNHAAA